jgi:gluconate 5-dehydrogenase
MTSVFELFDLSGRTAVVTGGGGSLGGAVSLGLSKAGARVIVIDISLANAQTVVDSIISEGGEAHAFAADLSTEVVVEDIFAKIDEIAPIDILVNAVAARYDRFPPDEYPTSEWDKAIASDLTSFFLTSRAAAQRMIKAGNGGSIINFGSIAGVTALGRGSVAYGAAKGGVIQMTRDCSFAWAQHNIRVNSILPCQFINAGWTSFINDPDHAKLVNRVKSGIPLGRLGEPHEMVGPVLFLASDAASMVTGVALPVDGGNLAMNPGGSIDW